jgi:class 3 adenylate cyclase
MAEGPENSPSTPLERKLVTVLSADVAEYSRLMAEDEEQTLRIFREHSQIFASLVTLYHGRIFNTAGDAILAEFTSAVEAVRCATEIQAALHTRNEQLPPARQVRFRIGINLGDVMIQNSDLLGDGVNVAARLQGAAEPGGICVSGSVYDQIRNKLSLTFEPMGERRFKNIPQPVRTFSVTGSEDHGGLPSSKQASKRGGLSIGLMAAALLLVVGGGGYAAYSMYQRSQTSPQPPPAKPATAVASAAPQPASNQPAAQSPPVTAPQPSPAEAPRNVVAPAAPQAQPAKQSPVSAPPQQSAADQPHAVPDTATASAQPEASPAASASGIDGIYGGRVCLGIGPQNPARCFRGDATVTDGKISGMWPNGVAGGATLVSGMVAPAGDVTIELRPGAGSRMLRPAHLSGTLHDGHLEATGTMVNGRTVSLTWHRN